jgi:hypothetical protein
MGPGGDGDGGGSRTSAQAEGLGHLCGGFVRNVLRYAQQCDPASITTFISKKEKKSEDVNSQIYNVSGSPQVLVTRHPAVDEYALAFGRADEVAGGGPPVPLRVRGWATLGRRDARANEVWVALPTDGADVGHLEHGAVFEGGADEGVLQTRRGAGEGEREGDDV